MSLNRLQLLEARSVLSVAAARAQRKHAAWSTLGGITGIDPEAIKRESRVLGETAKLLAAEAIIKGTKGKNEPYALIQSLDEIPDVEIKPYRPGDLLQDSNPASPAINKITPPGALQQAKSWAMDPANRKTLGYAAGGTAAAALLAAYIHRRRKNNQRRKQASLEDIKQKVIALKDRIQAAATDYAVKHKVQSTVDGATKGVSDKVQQWSDMLKQGLADPTKRPMVAALVGAAAGGSINTLAEAMNRRKKKRYLNAFLTGAGAGGLMGGAYGALVPSSSQAQAADVPPPAIETDIQKQLDAYNAADEASRAKILEEMERARQLGEPSFIKEKIFKPAGNEIAKLAPDVSGIMANNPVETGILGAGAAGAAGVEGVTAVQDWNRAQREIKPTKVELAANESLRSRMQKAGPGGSPVESAPPGAQRVDAAVAKARARKAAADQAVTRVQAKNAFNLPGDKGRSLQGRLKAAVDAQKRATERLKWVERAAVNVAKKNAKSWVPPATPSFESEVKYRAKLKELGETIDVQRAKVKQAPFFESKYTPRGMKGFAARRVMRTGLPMLASAIAAGTYHGFKDATNTSGELSGLTPLPK